MVWRPGEYEVDGDLGRNDLGASCSSHVPVTCHLFSTLHSAIATSESFNATLEDRTTITIES